MMLTTTKNNLTSLEVLEQINIFRKEESNRAELKHKTLLEIIRNEFDEEILDGKVLQSYYINSRGKTYPMFILTLSQVRRLFLRLKLYNLVDGVTEIKKTTRFEESFSNLLLEALYELNIECIKQYKVLNYRIDFYIPSINLAIEYDEEQHKNQIEKDKARENEIIKEIDCTFLRLDYKDSNIKNVIKVIMEVK